MDILDLENDEDLWKNTNIKMLNKNPELIIENESGVIIKMVIHVFR